MIRIVICREKNTYFLSIQNLPVCKKTDSFSHEVKGLCNALCALAENDENILVYKNKSSNEGIRIEITGGKHTEGAFRMVVEGLKALKRKNPKNIKFIERKD